MRSGYAGPIWIHLRITCGLNMTFGPFYSETPFFENLSIQLDLFAMVDLVVTYCPYKDKFLGVGVGVNYKWVPISYFLAGLKF